MKSIDRSAARTRCFLALFFLALLAASSAAFTHVGRSAPRCAAPPISPVVESTVICQSSKTRDTSSSTDNCDSDDRPKQSDYDSESLAAAIQQQAHRTKSIDQIVLINGLVVGVVAFGTLYELGHTHVEAVAALWEYGLGKHGPGISKLAVSIETMARLPGDLIHSYENLVPMNPIFYKACTSGIAYTLGDFISQIYQGRTLATLDLPRSFRSGAAGFIGHGPLCHYWLSFMETYLDFDGAWWGTGIKVTADLTVWSIFLNAVYSFIIGALAGRPPREVLADVKVTLWPALRSAWRFWPFVHTVSFSHAVPLDLKLLWVDVMEIVWVTILSKVANEDKNVKLAENPQYEFVNVTQSHGVEPSLEIELTRQEEMPSTISNPVVELPRKVWSAAWPLVVMWPVLYAGYQIEKLLGLEV